MSKRKAISVYLPGVLFDYCVDKGKSPKSPYASASDFIYYLVRKEYNTETLKKGERESEM